MTPQIKQTIKVGGHTLPLRFTIGLFAEAQQRTGIPFFPLGASEFWQQDEMGESGSIRMMYGLLYAGTQGAAAQRLGIDYDWFLENVGISEINKVAVYVQAELERFFHRLAKELKAETSTSETNATATISENSGPSADTTSA